MKHLSGKQLLPAVLLTLSFGISQTALASPTSYGSLPPPNNGNSTPGDDPHYSFTFISSDNLIQASGLLNTIENGNGSETVTSGLVEVLTGPDAGLYNLFVNPYKCSSHKFFRCILLR